MHSDLTLEKTALLKIFITKNLILLNLHNSSRLTDWNLLSLYWTSVAKEIP